MASSVALPPAPPTSLPPCVGYFVGAAPPVHAAPHTPAWYDEINSPAYGEKLRAMLPPLYGDAGDELGKRVWIVAPRAQPQPRTGRRAATSTTHDEGVGGDAMANDDREQLDAVCAAICSNHGAGHSCTHLHVVQVLTRRPSSDDLTKKKLVSTLYASPHAVLGKPHGLCGSDYVISDGAYKARIDKSFFVKRQQPMALSAFHAWSDCQDTLFGKWVQPLVAGVPLWPDVLTLPRGAPSSSLSRSRPPLSSSSAVAPPPSPSPPLTHGEGGPPIAFAAAPRDLAGELRGFFAGMEALGEVVGPLDVASALGADAETARLISGVFLAACIKGVMVTPALLASAIAKASAASATTSATAASSPVGGKRNRSNTSEEDEEEEGRAEHARTHPSLTMSAPVASTSVMPSPSTMEAAAATSASSSAVVPATIGGKRKRSNTSEEDAAEESARHAGHALAPSPRVGAPAPVAPPPPSGGKRKRSNTSEEDVAEESAMHAGHAVTSSPRIGAPAPVAPPPPAGAVSASSAPAPAMLPATASAPLSKPSPPSPSFPLPPPAPAVSSVPALLAAPWSSPASSSVPPVITADNAGGYLALLADAAELSPHSIPLRWAGLLWRTYNADGALIVHALSVEATLDSGDIATSEYVAIRAACFDRAGWPRYAGRVRADAKNFARDVVAESVRYATHAVVEDTGSGTTRVKVSYRRHNGHTLTLTGPPTAEGLRRYTREARQQRTAL